MLKESGRVARTTVVRAYCCGVGDGVCRVRSGSDWQVGRVGPRSVLRRAIERPTDGQGESSEPTMAILPSSAQLSTANFPQNSSRAARAVNADAFARPPATIQ